MKVSYRHKPRDKFLGRFGGGWNWKLGFAAGGKTIIFYLLVCMVIVSWEHSRET